MAVAASTYFTMKKSGSGNFSNFGRGRKMPPRNKNPWLDEELISSVSKNGEALERALNHYSDKDFKRYENVKTEGQLTALHRVIQTRQLDLVLRFLDLGACIHSTDKDGDTALHIAAQFGHEDIIKTLLKKNSNPFLANKTNKTPVDLALDNERNYVIPQLLEFMRENKSKFSDDIKKWVDKTYEAQIFIAIKSNDINILQSLLKKGLIYGAANVNAYSMEELCTPLHYAIQKRHIEIVRLLIEKGADINAINEYQETPLHKTLKDGEKDCVKLLLDKGADIAIYDNTDLLPIDIARKKEQQDVVELFNNYSKEVNDSIAAERHVKLFNILETKDALTEIILQDHIDDYHAQMLVRGLKSCTALTKIDLSNNAIGDESAKAIAKFVRQNQSLTHFDLSDNQISDIGFNTIIDALQDSQTLTYLNLSHNDLGLEGVRNLVKIFQQSNCRLEQLDLSNNRIDDKAISILADVLQNNRTLKSLNLSNDRYYGFKLTFKSAEALGHVLRLNQTLVKLNLSNNQIETRGIEIIANALKANQFLQQLDLSDNQIDDQGAIALAHAMQDLCILTELHLKGNAIGSKGAQALIEMFKKNQSLNKLILNSTRNYSREITINSLADIFKINRTLTRLDLSDFYLSYSTSSADIQTLTNALKKHRSLIVFNFSDHQFDRVINETLQNNMSLCQQFLAAAKDNDVNKVAELLKKGVSPCVMPEDEENMAIHLAAQTGHVEIVKLLSEEMMQRNITPAIANKQLKSALELARLNNRVEVVEILQNFEKRFYGKILVRTLERVLDESKEEQSVDIESQCNLIEEKANQGHQEIALEYAIWLSKNKELKIFSQEKCVHYLALAAKGSDSNMAQKAFNELGQLYSVDILKKLMIMNVAIPKVINETTKPLAISHLLRKADECLLDENFSEAIQHYSSVLEIDTKNIYALVRKGMALQELNQFDEAKQIYQNAITIEDKDAERYLQQAKNKLEEVEKQLTLQQQQPEVVPSKPIESQAADREELLGKGTIPFSQNRARYQFSQGTSSRQTHTNNSTSLKSIKGSTTWRR